MPTEDTINSGVLFFQMLVACAGVVLLAIVTLKYFLPFLARRQRNAKSTIQILDYQALQPKKAIYVVQIEDKKVAIGVTDHSINKICEL